MRTATSIDIHIFCDASEQAYGAVGYLRVKNGVECRVMILMAKARVAPLKPKINSLLGAPGGTFGTSTPSNIEGRIGVED